MSALMLTPRTLKRSAVGASVPKRTFSLLLCLGSGASTTLFPRVRSVKFNTDSFFHQPGVSRRIWSTPATKFFAIFSMVR